MMFIFLQKYLALSHAEDRMLMGVIKLILWH